MDQDGQLSLESVVKVHSLALPIENRPGDQWVGDNGGRLVRELKSPSEVEDADEQDGVGVRVSIWQARGGEMEEPTSRLL